MFEQENNLEISRPSVSIIRPPPSPHQANAAKEEKDDNEKGRSSCEISRADVRGEGAGGRGSVVPLLSLFQRVVKVRGERRRGEGVGGSS